VGWVTPASAARSGALPGWDGEEPDDQAKQEECCDERKQGMKRMKVKVGIPRETLSCGQHKTPFRRAFRGRGCNGWLIRFIVPLLEARFQCFRATGSVAGAIQN